jgi:hypothetical protein
MNKLELTDEQLNVIQEALDFYSRIGMGQFNRLVDHPTFDKILSDKFRPTEVTVGSRTPQGEVLEIKDNEALISGSVKDGKWCKEHEWKPLNEVVLSTNYDEKHEMIDVLNQMLIQPRNMLLNTELDYIHHSFGIYSDKVDESCRVAYDIIQVIRNARYIHRGGTSYTVDSDVMLTTKDSDKIKLNIEE